MNIVTQQNRKVFGQFGRYWLAIMARGLTLTFEVRRIKNFIMLTDDIKV